ncbi:MULTISPECIES: phenylacetaldehyde dehydrogenase StyD [Burkholderia]|uniref:phenylacetaldehyde dehydrogenase StyD n=1 Tax=Burkholderia TaxID=32008 RepID=UPI000398D0E7|nr:MULTISPECIES: aldehyde dehydrogenase family protein [Burkholderia]ERJ37756.1 Aldehyde dehydrogenase [Burkholderia sp. AU4i]MBA9945188.1 aldehyde dehydrogenase family protein [Burkholderia cepacia]MBA9975638.1 aldehyde dehydrogenase family protein [Burkholderia cepacia]MBA9993835.1 aldehyde dehydrogenase family protein [Burkholderia cepacia]MBB0001922.1 aldehyde dehydrogenase family protein [Burkholderia cepacia]
MNTIVTETPQRHVPNLRTHMLIAGEWREAQSGKTIAVFDPATGREIASVPDAGAADVDLAVLSAAKTFRSREWRTMLPAARERILLRLADLIEANGEELALLETRNNGKLLAYSRMFEVGGGAQWLRYMAGWATKIAGSTLDLSLPLPPGVRSSALTRRIPVGVVGAIIPWNFPLLMAIWKIAPALACGNTVVLKPAEETPLTALRLGELALEAGLPPGALNVVTGRGETAGAALVAHPGVNKIAFTGSTEVGRLIGATCGQNLKPVSLELGGKSPVLVLEDCDPATAAEGAAGAIFFNHGQVCTAGSRLYVHQNIYDEVLGKLSAIADNIVLGAGLDDSAQMGPLVSLRHQQRVTSLIQSGIEDGAELLCGSGSTPPDGYFVRPTVFANHDNRPIRLLKEEVFGPVLVAMPFSDLAEVVADANDSAYGLGASVWTNDLSAALSLTDSIEAGTVWINTHNMVDPNLPFGGFKSSGIGREHGAAAIDAYTTTKSVCIAY